MKQVKLRSTKADAVLIDAIMDRACGAGQFAKQPDPLISKGERLDVTMSITAVHLNGNPLDLQRLLAFDDFNFAHDVCGIARHIDTNTGQLTDFFSPRCTRRNPS